MQYRTGGTKINVVHYAGSTARYRLFNRLQSELHNHTYAVYEPEHAFDAACIKRSNHCFCLELAAVLPYTWSLRRKVWEDAETVNKGRAALTWLAVPLLWPLGRLLPGVSRESCERSERSLAFPVRFAVPPLFFMIAAGPVVATAPW